MTMAGRKVVFIGFGTSRGESVVQAKPGQGLGESCHSMLDSVNPGASVQKGRFDDNPDPRDLEYDMEEQARGV